MRVCWMACTKSVTYIRLRIPRSCSPSAGRLMRCCWRGRLGEWPFFFAGAPCELPTAIAGGIGGVALLLAGIAAATFVSFALHECVHALFFKVFGPSGSHVTFGWNLDVAMIYACAEGIVYSRERYLAIVLAPTIIVTGAAFVLGAFSGYSLASWGSLRAPSLRVHRRLVLRACHCFGPSDTLVRRRSLGRSLLR